MIVLFVCLGGALGALGRFVLSQWGFLRREYFPLPTLLINISGSAILGVMLFLFETQAISDTTWFFYGIGFCGSFTTFSTFSLEAVELLQSKKYVMALIYVLISLTATIAALLLGFTALN